MASFMSNTKGSSDWNRREVNFSKVHGDHSEAYGTLVNCLDLRNGQTIADLMGGYGEVSQHVLEECMKRGLEINLILSDYSIAQLKKSRQNLEDYERNGQKVVRVNSDIRSLPLKLNSLDKAIVKLGLHEIGKEDQVRALKAIYSSVRFGGELYVWSVFGKNKEINDYYRKIVRKKDELAGFFDMARNRYFSTEEELRDGIKKAGFSEMGEIYCGDFECFTSRFKNNDFKGDKERLREFNDYIRNLLPLDIRNEIGYEEQGDSINMSFTKKILVAKK